MKEIKELVNLINTVNFKGTNPGYSPIEVDRFLDEISKEIAQYKTVKETLINQNKALEDKIITLENAKNELEKNFATFKSKYRHINEEDIIDNKNSLSLIKKVNIYEEYLNSLGIDPLSLIN